MSKRLTIDEIRELSKASQKTLYGENSTNVCHSVSSNDQIETNRTMVVETDASNARTLTETSTEITSNHLVKSIRLQNALKIMRTQAEHSVQFLFRNEAVKISGIKGGATLLQAEKEALDAGLIKKHHLARAKTNICLWEITNRGYEYLNLARPKWPSKGDYLHKFCVHRIADTYKRLGFETEIEHCRPNGKLVDLRLSIGESVLFIEVCASRPVEKEIINIEKNSDGEPLPAEMIMAVTDRKMKKALDKAVSPPEVEWNYPCKVSIALAGDLIEFLEVAK
ncbi:MAG: hypothetical protein IIB00_07010 [candidate division Zixibacteria bacterium]|nr:hypothetical protein [candidate division Zixibacteria bacterium]